MNFWKNKQTLRELEKTVDPVLWNRIKEYAEDWLSDFTLQLSFNDRMKSLMEFINESGKIETI